MLRHAAAETGEFVWCDNGSCGELVGSSCLRSRCYKQHLGWHGCFTSALRGLLVSAAHEASLSLLSG